MSEIENIIARLEQQRAAIEKAIAALRGIDIEPKPVKRGPGRPKKASATSEGRERQREAMRKYWAQRRAAAQNSEA